MEIQSLSLSETRHAGERLARETGAGSVYGLVGDLGCGKTEFVRGFVDALCSGCEVRSPSFSILNIYETPAMPIFHFDFYRLKKQAELIEIGFEEYLYAGGVCLIEWADMFPEVMPKNASLIHFYDIGNGTRKIVC